MLWNTEHIFTLSIDKQVQRLISWNLSLQSTYMYIYIFWIYLGTQDGMSEGLRGLSFVT